MPAVYAALLMLTISQADCSITKSVSRRRFLFVRCMNNFHNSTKAGTYLSSTRIQKEKGYEPHSLVYCKRLDRLSV